MARGICGGGRRSDSLRAPRTDHRWRDALPVLASIPDDLSGGGTIAGGTRLMLMMKSGVFRPTAGLVSPAQARRAGCATIRGELQRRADRRRHEAAGPEVERSPEVCPSAAL